MSMDWSPVVLYTVDRNMAKDGYDSLRNHEIFLVLSDNAKKSLTNKDAQAGYPELSFLFDNFNALYEKYKGNDNATMVFAKAETALKETEKELDAKDTGDASADSSNKEYYYLDEDGLAKCDISDVTREWFYGRLDKCFYYCTENNRVFSRYLETKIAEMG